MRMAPDGSGLRYFARGVRNSVGLTGALGRTSCGSRTTGATIWETIALPMSSTTRLRRNEKFGFPYCHGKDILDPGPGSRAELLHYTAPAMKSSAPTLPRWEIRFYTGSMFPQSYRNRVFLAEHGSWNRSTKIGYRVMLVQFEDGTPINKEVFADGWLQADEAWGRPVDVQVMPDGALLVSDDKAGAILIASGIRAERL